LKSLSEQLERYKTELESQGQSDSIKHNNNKMDVSGAEVEIAGLKERN
jgi:hypothetical protein